MKPLICPQCGGKITQYNQFDKFATCQYCDTKFLIEQEKQVPVYQPEPTYRSSVNVTDNLNIVVVLVVVFGVIFGGIIFAAIVKQSSKKSTDYPTYTKNSPRNVYSTPSPTPTPKLNLLEFGGKGTSNGLFQNASEIAVDKKGRIYVADDTLRVQQFNEKGEFLKLWQIPSQTKHYKKARTIQKIAVDDRDKLYVLVRGVVQMWDQNSTDLPDVTFHAAPDFMVDFALRSDGGLLMVAVDNDIETLIFMNRSEKVTKRIRGFHTETADPAMSPFETGLAAIRLAVDGAGNIFSIYAFGDLGSYQLSYNADELLIFRFTPEGKYVNKFVQTMNSVGIEIDNQSRIYISENDSINVYRNNGEIVSSINELSRMNAFALDSQNNVYVLLDDRVVKRPAIN